MGSYPSVDLNRQMFRALPVWQKLTDLLGAMPRLESGAIEFIGQVPGFIYSAVFKCTILILFMEVSLIRTTRDMVVLGLLKIRITWVWVTVYLVYYIFSFKIWASC